MEDPASDTKPRSPSLEKSPAAQGKEPTHLKCPWMSSKDGSGQSQFSHPEKLLENISLRVISYQVLQDLLCSLFWRLEAGASHFHDECHFHGN